MQALVRIVLVTCPAERAEGLARALVEARVAACVNLVGPVRSIYRWAGAVESADEVQLLIKTTTDRIAELRREVLARHPYEVPEFLVLDVEDGAGPYVQWVLESTRPVK